MTVRTRHRGNPRLAARARQIAARAAPGSASRRSALCAAIALSSTRTPAAAVDMLVLAELGGVGESAINIVAGLDRRRTAGTEASQHSHKNITEGKRP